MSRKPDELALYEALRARCRPGSTQPGLHTVDEQIARLGIHEKRGYSLLEKWTDRGWWDYGVSLRSGWFTDKAPPTLNEEPPARTNLPPGSCTASGHTWHCRAPAEVAGMCFAHYQSLRRAKGDRRALLPLRAEREPGIRLPAPRVSPGAAAALEAEANRRGIGVATLERDVLEDWARRAQGEPPTRAR